MTKFLDWYSSKISAGNYSYQASKTPPLKARLFAAFLIVVGVVGGAGLACGTVLLVAAIFGLVGVTFLISVVLIFLVSFIILSVR